MQRFIFDAVQRNQKRIWCECGSHSYEQVNWCVFKLSFFECKLVFQNKSPPPEITPQTKNSNLAQARYNRCWIILVPSVRAFVVTMWGIRFEKYNSRRCAKQPQEHWSFWIKYKTFEKQNTYNDVRRPSLGEVHKLPSPLYETAESDLRQ
jgi:hypothetical protein